MKFSEYLKANPQATRSNAKQQTKWQLAEGVADVELNDYVAFIYRITLNDGKVYIGRKKLHVGAGAKPPSEYPRKTFKMSDWLVYCTSSVVVSGRVKNGSYLKAEIIYWSKSWSISALHESMFILNEWENDPKNSWNFQLEIPMLNRENYLRSQ